MRRWFQALSVESWAIILVCVADLLITLVLIHHGLAEEGNPIMRFYLGYGVWAFVLAKSVLVLAPIVIIEWGRIHRPRAVRALARVGIGCYLGIYAGMFLLVNVPAITLAQRSEFTEAEAYRMRQELIRRKLDKHSQSYGPYEFERYLDLKAVKVPSEY